MKKKGIAVISALVITVVSIFGVAYADDVKAETQESGQPKIENQTLGASCHSSKDGNKDMIEIMRENGFKDAARYMQTGDYEKMNEFMNNLSEEDFQKMIDIMEENGYGSMAQMMQSIGREGMIEMHNSMSSMHSGSFGMMRGWRSDI